MEKQHFEILLENMDSKINLMLENFRMLDKKIVAFHYELKEDISLLDLKLTALSQRLDSVETNLSARIDAVHSRLLDHRNNSEMHSIPCKRAL